MRTRIQCLLVFGACLAALVLAGMPTLQGRADPALGSPSAAFLAHLTIQASDEATGEPVAGAHVAVAELGLEGETDGEGRLSWRSLSIPQAEFAITVTVRAAGYGEWRLVNVRLLADDTLIVKPALGPEPYVSYVPPPRAEEPIWPEPFEMEAQLAREYDLAYASRPLPRNIRVRLSAPLYPYPQSSFACDPTRKYLLRVVDFKDYVRHVLPNEWGASWPVESLRAGAMAVKMYGWRMIALGGKWSDADVWDSTCDQVYNPNFERESTNQAVDAIWDWMLSNADFMAKTYYRAYYEQCLERNLQGTCMGQWESRDLAAAGYSWQAILAHFYQNTALSRARPPAQGGYSLRFNGQPGDLDQNRVLIPVDDPATADPGPPADVGAADFTIEWWMKALPEENLAPAVNCGANENWIFGNILLDRDLQGLERDFGVSVAGRRLAFGVSADGGRLTLCGARNVADGAWHHVAVQRQRSSGYLWIFVDGQLDALADGPEGDISYPDAYVTEQASDPFLAIGAWKKDVDQALHPFFQGWIDELRISNVLRYAGNFSPPAGPFAVDSYTQAVYHFDEGLGSLITDESTATAIRSHGNRKYGGSVDGPVWALSDLFRKFFVPLVSRARP